MSAAVALSVITRDLSSKVQSSPAQLTPYLDEHRENKKAKVEEGHADNTEHPPMEVDTVSKKDEAEETLENAQDEPASTIPFYPSPFEYLPFRGSLTGTKDAKENVSESDGRRARVVIGDSRTGELVLKEEDLQGPFDREHGYYATPIKPYRESIRNNTANTMDPKLQAPSRSATMGTSFHDIDEDIQIEEEVFDLSDLLYMFALSRYQQHPRVCACHVHSEPEYFLGEEDNDGDEEEAKRDEKKQTTPPPYVPTPVTNPYPGYEYDITNGYGHGYYDEKDITAAVIVDASPSESTLPPFLPGGPPIATATYYADHPAGAASRTGSGKNNRKGQPTINKGIGLMTNSCLPMFSFGIRAPDTPTPSDGVAADKQNGTEETDLNEKLSQHQSAHKAFVPIANPNNTHPPSSSASGPCPCTYPVGPSCLDHFVEGVRIQNKNINATASNNQAQHAPAVTTTNWPYEDPNFTSLLAHQRATAPKPSHSQRVWQGGAKEALQYLMALVLAGILFVLAGFSFLGILSVVLGNPGGADGRSVAEICADYGVQPRFCRVVLASGGDLNL